MDAGVRELRLAVVCYGGVSLAVYMHGQTKEIHRLAKASALLDGGGSEEPMPSERAYGDLLRRLAEQDEEHVRTRVVVDVLAGTSAGGINAVYLAKALAHNLPQEGLRDVWLDRGDIAVLLRGPQWLPWRLRMLWNLGWVWRRPPLRGDQMSAWLYDALQGMDDRPPAATSHPSLMPEGHLLELFVTVTDFYGYPREVTVSEQRPADRERPTAVRDWRHRHVMEFRFGDGSDHFSREQNIALALAARATSSYPGAFPPLTLPSFEANLQQYGTHTPPPTPSGLERAQFRHYRLSRASARKAFFIDGGVLDNHPFGHALRAIRERPADREVDRRLLYLDPDPGTDGGDTPARQAPGPITNTLGAISGIPRKEPILDDLLALSSHNEKVERLRDVIETSWEAVAARAQEVIEDPLDRLPADARNERVERWMQGVQAAARDDANLMYPTYVRAKLSAAIDGYARSICVTVAYPDDCDQAAFARRAVRAWARRKGLFAAKAAVGDEQVAFLRSFDLDYGIRRIRFLIDGLNWLYRDRAIEAGHPTREQLDALKARLYDAKGTLESARSALVDSGEVSKQVAACFGEEALWRFSDRSGYAADEFARRYESELDGLCEAWKQALQDRLEGFSARLYADIVRLTDGWHTRDRRDMFVRYLGFPLWDVLLYPIQSLAGVGERDHVEVMRLSPLESRLLSDRGQPKLAGSSLQNFGAFFTREGRERDYLWGRLDAGERLVELLLGPDHPEGDSWRRRVLAAIIQEEAGALPGAADLTQAVMAALRDRREEATDARPEGSDTGRVDAPV